jgi:hypothetical protein
LLGYIFLDSGIMGDSQLIQRASRPARMGHEVTIFVTRMGQACMKKATQARGFLISGGSGEIRTRDQRIKSPLLYRLSYRPVDKSGNLVHESARL